MNKFLIAFLVLVLASLACTKVEDVASVRQLPTFKPDPVFTLTSLPTQEDPTLLRVVVLAELVNIRSADGSTQGITAKAGESLVIRVIEGKGFAYIVYPVQWNGMKIWRGCTSEPANFGCEASE